MPIDIGIELDHPDRILDAKDGVVEGGMFEQKRAAPAYLPL
jgi:hypothetical protein